LRRGYAPEKHENAGMYVVRKHKCHPHLKHGFWIEHIVKGTKKEILSELGEEFGIMTKKEYAKKKWEEEYRTARWEEIPAWLRHKIQRKEIERLPRLVLDKRGYAQKKP